MGMAQINKQNVFSLCFSLRKAIPFGRNVLQWDSLAFSYQLIIVAGMGLDGYV